MSNKFSILSLLVLLWVLLFINQVFGEEYEEGMHYKVLPIPVQLLKTEGINVVEIFHYRCGYCFRFQPELNKWRETLPEYVNFGRFPAAYRGDKLLFSLSKAYYTAKKLGKLNDLHGRLFDATLFRKPKIKSEESIAAVFGEADVTREEFNNIFYSDEINEMAEKSVNLLEILAISGTPRMVVNGKYLISGASAGGKNEMMFDVVEFLIEKERKKEGK